MVQDVLRKEMLNWYEAGLPIHERKIRGHFSTPPLLVSAILDACGYTADADLSRLRVLDPACGSGNFLAGAAQRMMASGRQRGLHARQLLASLRRNVWGFDPDPVACFLAEMQIRDMLSQQGMAGSFYNQHRLHIHQADGLALPWEQEQCESVDLFLANPPYLAAKNADLSGYRSAQGLGQLDSYLLFLRLALQVVRPDGWIGLVLPDAVLARANATRERQRLLEETTVHAIWHLSNVFPAYVGAVVIIAQKRVPKSVHQIAWAREKWSNREDKTLSMRDDVAMSCIAQSLLRIQPGAELRYLLGNEYKTLIERLHRYMTKQEDGCETLAPLSRFVSIRRGEELGKRSTLLACAEPAEQGWYPLLRGGVDVRPYGTPQGEYWIEGKAVGKPLERYAVPKLLVVKSTSLLQAALDVQGHVALQTLYLLTLNDKIQAQCDGEHGIQGASGDMTTNGNMTGASPVTTKLSPLCGETVYSSDRACPCHVPVPYRESLDTLYFLLALLNSRLLQRYVYILHTAYKLVQPQIEQHVLARLPIAMVEMELQWEIVERAKQIMLACSVASPVVELKQQITLLCEEQERAICALYEHALHL